MGLKYHTLCKINCLLITKQKNSLIQAAHPHPPPLCAFNVLRLQKIRWRNRYSKSSSSVKQNTGEGIRSGTLIFLHSCSLVCWSGSQHHSRSGIILPLPPGKEKCILVNFLSTPWMSLQAVPTSTQPPQSTPAAAIAETSTFSESEPQPDRAPLSCNLLFLH